MADVTDQGLLPGLQKQLHDRFGIDHSSIQMERESGNPCMLDKPECEYKNCQDFGLFSGKGERVCDG